MAKDGHSEEQSLRCIGVRVLPTKLSPCARPRVAEMFVEGEEKTSAFMLIVDVCEWIRLESGYLHSRNNHNHNHRRRRTYTVLFPNQSQAHFYKLNK